MFEMLMMFKRDVMMPAITCPCPKAPMYSGGNWATSPAKPPCEKFAKTPLSL